MKKCNLSIIFYVYIYLHRVKEIGPALTALERLERRKKKKKKKKSNHNSDVCVTT